MAGPYKDVRSLARGLRILETLGEMGWTSPGTLSREVEIDRSTIYRLLNTLVECGYVVRRREDGAVTLTAKLSRISDGIKNDDLHAQIAAPFIRKLTTVVLWPSDFASFNLGEVSIRFSTHKISPMSIHRSVIGKSRALLRSAIGKAIASEMSEQELEAARAIVYGLGGRDAEDLRNKPFVERIVAKVHADGYASSTGETDSKISAIAVPIKGPERVIGALNLVFFSSVMTPDQAAEQYLAPMRACVRSIETAISTDMAL